MKLFMEINPQLFDDCSHDYTELQSTADQRQQLRQSKWDTLAEQAKRMSAGQTPAPQPSLSIRGPKVTASSRVDEVDPITQDSQQRLDALKLQDENANGNQPRRSKDQENQISV